MSVPSKKQSQTISVLIHPALHPMTEGNVTLDGTTYVADDLTVEKNAKSGDGSQVKIAGEYYGFGSPDSAI